MLDGTVKECNLFTPQPPKPPLFTPEQVAEIQAESRGSECLTAFGFGVICTFIVGMSGWNIWAWLTK